MAHVPLIVYIFHYGNYSYPYNYSLTLQGLLSNFDKGRTLRYILNQFKRIGYTTSEAILYASDYGVPQHRNRFFIVGKISRIYS